MGDVFRVQERFAAKDHRCGECALVIPKGDLYMYCSGVHEGAGFSHKMHGRCYEVMSMAARYARYEDETPRLGDLAEWLVGTLLEGVNVGSYHKRTVINAAHPVLADLLRRGERTP